MSAPVESYTTLAEPFRYEPDKIKGSRFIACIAPAETEAEAQAFLESVRAEFDDARHVCWAWRLGGAGEETRSNDDGEPSGSAGRPILLQLEGHGVTDVMACVVRYFGGVKLGVGGLMRAYGGAAGQALDRAELKVVDVKVTLVCTHAYGDSGAVSGVLAAWELGAENADYGEEVTFSVRVGIGRVEEFQAAIREATAARASVEAPGKVPPRGRP
ncbi:IMPACT family member YigZ [Planctomycetes bacterium Poly30]|uniref:IMPACT family member YigZ n=1 Tax=Saltatorellus ferox TaxID=2528018 RepID=A0A518EZI8_9BACT|nr:IMPACT family member YigZ [Planctomycetes bacterium Poly30]